MKNGGTAGNILSVASVTSVEPKMDWNAAAEATRGKLLCGSPSDPLGPLCTDSRTLEAQGTFWALKGERFDAHRFLDEKLARRAGGWVVEAGAPLPDTLPSHVLKVADTKQALGDLAKAYRKGFEIPIVGITGSNGKTSVKEMLRAIFNVRAPVCASAGNFNNEIGLPLSVLSLSPDAHRFAVFEMGASHPGDIAYLCKIAQPTFGIITNIGPAHLEFLGDLDGVLQTKRALADGVPAPGGLALNLDDPRLKELAQEFGDRVVGYGRAAGARVRVLDGAGIVLSLAGEKIEVSGPFGPIHRINAAAAAAAALAHGFSAAEIQQGLGAYRPADMRFETRSHKSGTSLVVDAYNANPGSVRAGIKTFLETCDAPQRIVVLGDMFELGAHSKSMHEEIGGWLATLPIQGAYFAGDEMLYASAALRAANADFRTEHAATALALAPALRDRLGKDTAVYFKASRAMRFERLIESL